MTIPEWVIKKLMKMKLGKSLVKLGVMIAWSVPPRPQK
jgi:hypothetical protein